MNSLAKTMITSLVILLVIGVAALIIVLNFNKGSTKGEGRSIDEMNEYSYETPEVTTDLKDGKFVRIQFQIIADGKKGLKEVEKREFQIKNILIKELAVMTEEDFKTGLSDLEATLQSSLNEVMTDGDITDVYTVSKILQ
ncbi:flagellar basal body-associated protein FliL [Pseudogracilibacillus auburnensis]|uniref:Flagellar protein FliL n=1 Tax=Pseudogracilibacillus auburnensis TaxID=1494959 RepID=A0A2V3W8N2_9BACI|nr:flagellar basal body-associated protein FliL [Pseudogracilibacillus auburnensis]MBO1003799.1 flagellar basal body-associated protein FliL [Pseudogracilibacillus auburnensis]PXW88615.1 flagellar FliL protein [Pseudogracilibacillus auburnensis]